MLVNNTDFDCKQQFRNALNELITERNYQEKVSIIRYTSWNNNFKQDLKKYYIEDQMHLNEKGYMLLDSIIGEFIIRHKKKADNHLPPLSSFAQ